MIELLTSIVIDLSDQRLYAYSTNSSPIYSSYVSTGAPSTPTPTGIFHIHGKYPRTDLVGEDYRVNLPDVMCLGGEGIRPDRYCIHPTPYPSIPLGTPQSHGCIRTSTATARWLFERTTLDTTVTIKP